jgi:hypothetical protein
LWAKKAWGVYWTWDPRLTTLMLNVLLYASVVLLRAFAGSGDAERRFAAALTVLGTLLLPVIHYAVKLWGGIHPTVVTQGGGGLQHPDMKTALLLGFVAMTFLAAVLLWSRARLASAVGLAAVEEVATARGIGAGHEPTAATSQDRPLAATGRRGESKATSAEALLVAAYLVMWALLLVFVGRWRRRAMNTPRRQLRRSRQARRS